MVRLEGLGGRAAGDGVEHGGLDLDEVAVLEEAADIRDDAAALLAREGGGRSEVGRTASA